MWEKRRGERNKGKEEDDRDERRGIENVKEGETPSPSPHVIPVHTSVSLTCLNFLSILSSCTDLDLLYLLTYPFNTSV